MSDYMDAREVLQADFKMFGISEELGFCLQEPLTNLPDYYRVWVDVANDLSRLVESHQLRDLVHKMPVLSHHHLTDHRELMLAHMMLGMITMGYVWQEGQHAPAQILPEALARPFWLISCKLGLPPILTYADMLQANWKLKDPTQEMEIGNVDMLYFFPGGESSKGFFLVSLMVEVAASSGLRGTLEVMRAMETLNITGIQKALNKVTQSVKKMKETFKLMHSHVNPSAFYETVRIFVSGWRDNPMLPNGLLYEGISDEPVLLSGVSAAQSAAIQCFDVLLCVRHENSTGDFLMRMRDYMRPANRQLIETLSLGPSLRNIVLSQSNSDLCQAFNSCVSALVDLRNYHLCAVTKYILIPGNQAKAACCPLSGVGTALKDVGTGGSNLMAFLQSARDNTKKALVTQTFREN